MKKRGPLVKVEIEPGRFVKMYKQDVLKMQQQKEDKMVEPSEDKMLEPSEDKAPDDFTTIDGVGPATANALVDEGITSFEQLKDAALNNLHSRAKTAIQEWRDE